MQTIDVVGAMLTRVVLAGGAGTMDGVGTPTLTGPRVTLRPVEPADLAARQTHGWHGAIERCYGHSTGDRPMSDDEARAWYDDQVLRLADHATRHWVIDVAGELAGVAFLHSISEADRKARFAIGMFAPQFLGRGMGGEATRMVLQHAFTVMDLHRVDLRVLAFNEAAMAMYQRCGFVEEGREREVCWLDGRWHDDVIMGVLAQEFHGA